MALESDLETRICLTWTTEKPSTDTPRKSNVFNVLGAECYLELMLINGYYNLNLNRKYDNRQITLQAFEITTYLNFGHNSACSSLINTKYIRSTSDVVWEFKDEIVLRNLPKSLDARWKFFCLFHVSPASVGIKNGTIHLSIQSSSSDKCVQDSARIPPDVERLCEDFSNLLVKKIFPDAHLHCEGQTRPVHKSILATRSEVFAAKFQNIMTARETISIDVTDLNVPVLDMLLTYVYSGKIPDICVDTAADLYEAGDKYAMSALKTACSDWMVFNITEENCIGYLYVADKHNDAKLKNAVMTFMNDHPGIFSSEKWLRFSKEHSKLGLEVLQGYAISSNK